MFFINNKLCKFQNNSEFCNYIFMDIYSTR